MHASHPARGPLSRVFWVLLELAAVISGTHRFHARETVVYGRVQDARTRRPVEAGRVSSADSTSVAFSD
jgi:hypothetical protein